MVPGARNLLIQQAPVKVNDVREVFLAVTFFFLDCKGVKDLGAKQAERSQKIQGSE